MSPVLERADGTTSGARSEPRLLDQIFPQLSDAMRGREMQGTWVAFCQERAGAVRKALGDGRSPPEIAYAVGELVHTYFRARGVTLTSYELRRLVAELLELHAPTQPVIEQKSAAPRVGDKGEAPALVSFAGDPARRATSWTGDELAKPAPVVPNAAFKPPPSRLVKATGREATTFDRLLARVLDIARPRLAVLPGRRIARDEALRAIDAAIDEVARGDEETLRPELRERLALVALSEICGLGLVDRLWADRRVRAVFVNAPQAVYVERNGLLEPSPEVFRDQEHLLDLVSRLVPRPTAGVAEFKLRDGGSGTVIFPPAAPDGPVVVIRRGEPGTATFERLIAADMLDRPIADLLRIAARCRLNMLLSGPGGSGKTALLAAIARDLGGGARVVTIARHREFRWEAPGKVELVPLQSGAAGYPALLVAALQLQPHLLTLDSLQPEDLTSLAGRLSQAARGIVAAVESEAMTAALARSVDLVVRLGRGRDGLFRVVSLDDATGAAIFAHDAGRFHRRTATPAFAASVHAAGYGEALASVLR